MEQSQATAQAIKLSRTRWILMLCWVLGLYLIATSILSALEILNRWSYLQGLAVMDDTLNIYPLLALVPLKLINGVLLFIRSRWVLLTIPAWIVTLLFSITTNEGWNHLPSDFFLTAALQGCILSFALWAFGRGYLKR